MRKLPQVPNAYHLREEVFRRYERDIGVLIRNWPDGTVFQMERLRPVTYCSQLRSAMASVLANRWDTDIDVEKLAEIRDSIQLTVRDDKVLAYKRGESSLDPVFSAVTSVTRFFLDLKNPSVDAMRAACVLLVEGHSGTLPVRVTNPHPDFVPEPPHDMTRQPDGSYLLL